jgi:aldehyde dehydrogenase (NAD+)
MKHLIADDEVLLRTHFAKLLDNQRQTALAWRSSTAKDRLAHLKKLSDWILKNQDAIRKALWADFKKPAIETDLSEIFPVTSEIAPKHLCRCRCLAQVVMCNTSLRAVL